jgi:hypothetical protein
LREPRRGVAVAEGEADLKGLLASKYSGVSLMLTELVRDFDSRDLRGFESQLVERFFGFCLGFEEDD